jgi:hypothetical protein
MELNGPLDDFAIPEFFISERDTFWDTLVLHDVRTCKDLGKEVLVHRLGKNVPQIWPMDRHDAAVKISIFHIVLTLLK